MMALTTLWASVVLSHVEIGRACGRPSSLLMHFLINLINITESGTSFGIF